MEISDNVLNWFKSNLTNKNLGVPKYCKFLKGLFSARYYLNFNNHIKSLTQFTIIFLKNRKMDDITPDVKLWHCLPVFKKIDFKMLQIVNKALTGVETY